MIETKLEYPFCTVDGVYYNLELVNDVLRFPDAKPMCVDLNKMVLDYANGKIKLKELWDEYSQTGSSYEMVDGLFSHFGMNNHIVKQGLETCKTLVLHSGDPSIDVQYNYSEEEMVYAKIEEDLEEFIEGGFVEEKDMLISRFENYIKQLKKL